MNRNKLKIITLISLIFTVGCANLVIVKPPEISLDEGYVDQAVDLSWENAQIAFFSTRPAKYLGKILDHTGFVFLTSDNDSQMAYLEGTFHSQEFPIIWSRDGQKILVVAYDDRIPSYCLLLMDKVQKKCLIGDGRAPSWSPDNLQVAYYMPAYYENGNKTTPSTLNILDLESGQSKSIVNLPDSKTPSLSTWSPNGNSLAYEAYDQANAENQIWIYSFLSEKKNFLTDGETPVWSPIGDEIAFIRDEKLWLVNLTTQQETRLLSQFKNISWPAWSPDGKKLLFVSTDTGNGDIYYLDRASNKVTQLTNDSSSDEAPSWRP